MQKHGDFFFIVNPMMERRYMHIQTVLHFDKGDGETEVIVSDGEYELLCHAFPIAAVEIGMPVSGLSGFSCSDVVRAENPRCGATKLPPYFAYHMTGILFSKQKRIVRVGGLEIDLDAYMPNDLSDGEYVSFDVQRVDLDN